MNNTLAPTSRSDRRFSVGPTLAPTSRSDRRFSIGPTPAPIVVLGTPHRLREPGKQSPDGRLSECVYGRQIAAMVKTLLDARAITTLIDYEPLDLPVAMQCSNTPEERLRELNMRVTFAVDVSSGIETDGIKDAARMRAFMRAVRGNDKA